MTSNNRMREVAPETYEMIVGSVRAVILLCAMSLIGLLIYAVSRPERSDNG